MAPEVTPDAIMQLGFGCWGSKTLLTPAGIGPFHGIGRVTRVAG